VGQCGLAGIGPRRQPVRADIGCGVRQLADQRACGLIVKAIEVFIVVRLGFQARVAIRNLDDLQPTVGAKASLEGVVGRIVDEGTIVGRMGKNEEKRSINVVPKRSLIPGLI